MIKIGVTGTIAAGKTVVANTKAGKVTKKYTKR